ncbi:ATP-binding protein [Saccharopolyspora kobensis]|uniref:ATP-binding protein n=1 Tax=Saccharopolyspora kobensis TaxID=146035 RepID=UPI000AD87051|nr:ATP-binding protein [Saccharopolyspora kobensis]
MTGPGGARSLQEVLRQRQGSEFVGRRRQCDAFRANLRAPVAERKFVFGLHGQAGIGKTFLLRQLREISLQHSALVAVTDDNESNLVRVLAAIARQLAGQGGEARKFAQRFADYEQRHDEVLSDPQAPSEARELVMATAVRFGLGVVRAAAPGLGPVADAVPPERIQEWVEQCRGYLARRFGSQADVRLLLSPVEELTPCLVDDLRKIAHHRQLVVLFDNYERTAEVVEPWLLRLLHGYYGELPLGLVLGVAGQHPLDFNNWGEFSSILVSWRLDPFTAEESRTLLGRKGVRDPELADVILELSGGLPLLLASLAESGGDDVHDPTGMAVARFLNFVPEQESRDDAVLAALPRVLDEDVLAVLREPGRAVGLFRWLRERPFVHEDQGQLKYHHVVREKMVRYERGRAPRRFRQHHQALAEHFRQRREELGLPGDSCWFDWEWRMLLVEEFYHRLCSAAHRWLPEALHHCATACGIEAEPAVHAWLDVVAAAARDSATGAVVTCARDLQRFVAPGGSVDRAELRRYLTRRLEEAGFGQVVGARPIAPGGESENRLVLGTADQDFFGGGEQGSAPVIGE